VLIFLDLVTDLTEQLVECVEIARLDASDNR
jgi:hypothetical protein